MRRYLLSAAAGLLATAALPSVAAAANAEVTTDLNMRAGPSTAFPVVEVIPDDANITVHGCVRDYSWCDATWRGARGWIAANYIRYFYSGRYVPLVEYVEVIDVPVVTFVFDTYWDTYYRDRPWYGRRAHFRFVWRDDDRRERRADRREDRREDRADRRRDRREDRAERREDRREARQDLRQEKRADRRDDRRDARAERGEPRREAREDRRRSNRAERQQQRREAAGEQRREARPDRAERREQRQERMSQRFERREAGGDRGGGGVGSRALSGGDRGGGGERAFRGGGGGGDRGGGGPNRGGGGGGDRGGRGRD